MSTKKIINKRQIVTLKKKMKGNLKNTSNQKKTNQVYINNIIIYKHNLKDKINNLILKLEKSDLNILLKVAQYTKESGKEI